MHLDGNGKYGISNDNSISIEMCINSDGNFEKTYQSTIELTKYLMNKYNIPIDRVVRHYDASRKTCPYIFSKNNWAKWHEFKSKLVEVKQVDYSAIITKLYKNLFNREPDSEGLKYWNNRLNNGLTIGDFMKEMAGTQEFKEIYID